VSSEHVSSVLVLAHSLPEGIVHGDALHSHAALPAAPPHV
jgi:hypothetical protein